MHHPTSLNGRCSLSIPPAREMTLLSVQGTNTSNFTSTKALFLAYPQTDLWGFEVVYSFPTASSSSALNFVISQPPSNGSCSIEPSNGTTTSPFHVSCPNWFDQDGIKDYSLYRMSRSNRSGVKMRVCVVLVWSSVPSERAMIAFSSVSTFQVRLPSGYDPTFSLALVIYIRDTRECITEWNLTSIVVRPDFAALDDLITQLEDPSSGLTNNPFTQLLVKGNQNTVGQVSSLLSQQLNQMSTTNLQDAVSSNLFLFSHRENRSFVVGGVPAAGISVSPLGAQRSSPLVISSIPLNNSALDQFNKDLNSQASVREYLIGFITSLPINTLNTIKSQSTPLAQLTQATNQLTHTVLVRSLSDGLEMKHERIGRCIEAMLSTRKGYTSNGSSNSGWRSSDVCGTTDAVFHESSHSKMLLCGHETETNIFSKAVNGPL